MFSATTHVYIQKCILLFIFRRNVLVVHTGAKQYVCHFAVAVVWIHGAVSPGRAPHRPLLAKRTSLSRRGVCDRPLRVDQSATYRRQDTLVHRRTRSKVRDADTSSFEPPQQGATVGTPCWRTSKTTSESLPSVGCCGAPAQWRTQARASWGHETSCSLSSSRGSYPVEPVVCCVVTVVLPLSIGFDFFINLHVTFKRDLFWENTQDKNTIMERFLFIYLYIFKYCRPTDHYREIY